MNSALKISYKTLPLLLFFLSLCLVAELMVVYRNYESPILKFERIGLHEGEKGIFMTLTNNHFTPIRLRSHNRSITHEYYEDQGMIQPIPYRIHFSELNEWEEFPPGEHEVFLKMDYDDFETETQSIVVKVGHSNRSLVNIFTERYFANGEITSRISLRDMAEPAGTGQPM